MEGLASVLVIGVNTFDPSSVPTGGGETEADSFQSDQVRRLSPE